MIPDYNNSHYEYVIKAFDDRMAYDVAYKSMTSFEGFYSNNRRDHGGKTYRGITKKNFPKWEGWKIVNHALSKGKKHYKEYFENNTRLEELVQKFYYDNFWKPFGLDKLARVDPGLAIFLFDTGVNMSGERAMIFFKRAYEREFKIKMNNQVITDEEVSMISYFGKRKILNHVYESRVRKYYQIGNKFWLKHWLWRTVTVYNHSAFMT